MIERRKILAVVVIFVSGFLIYRDFQNTQNTGGLQGEAGILRADGSEKIIGRELIPFSTWGIGGAKLEEGDALYCKAWLQILPEGFPAELEEIDLTVKHTINGGPIEKMWGTTTTGDIPRTFPVEAWWNTPLPQDETSSILLQFRNSNAQWTPSGYVGGVSHWTLPVEDINARLQGFPDGDYVIQVTYVINRFSVTWDEYGSKRVEDYWYEGNPDPGDGPTFSSVLIVDLTVTKTSPTLSVSVSSESSGASLKIRP